ncbi:MAG: flavodoxin family protein [Candidatus Bathyarchaeia archaeon]|jgi:flavodoxin
MKCFVVYYTRTGKTKFVAETVAAELGADLEEIVDLKKREGKLGWIMGGKDASQKKLTDLAPLKRTPADYDLVVVGTPIWAWAPTPAFRTYINQNNLADKKVALFYTFDSDPKQASQKIHEILPGVNVVGELPLKDPSKNKEDTQNKIKVWCSALKEAASAV